MNSIVFKGVIIRGVCFFKHNNIFLYIKKIQDVSQFVNFANDLITRAFVRINESNVITLYKNRCIDRTRYVSFKSWMDQNGEFHHIVFLCGSKITGLMGANDLKDRSMIQRRPRMPSRCRSPSLSH